LASWLDSLGTSKLRANLVGSRTFRPILWRLKHIVSVYRNGSTGVAKWLAEGCPKKKMGLGGEAEARSEKSV
jgi:hypothetical protein